MLLSRLRGNWTFSTDDFVWKFLEPAAILSELLIRLWMLCPSNEIVVSLPYPSGLKGGLWMMPQG